MHLVYFSQVIDSMYGKWKKNSNAMVDDIDINHSSISSIHVFIAIAISWYALLRWIMLSSKK